LNRMGV